MLTLKTHLRTIAVILLVIGTIVFLSVHPAVAWTAYIGLWVCIGLAAIVLIYSWIYLALEPKEQQLSFAEDYYGSYIDF